MKELVLDLCNNPCVVAVVSVVAGLAVMAVIAVLIHLLVGVFDHFKGGNVWKN